MPGFARLLVAALDTTDINDNIYAVLDVGRARAKKFLSDCEIAQEDTKAVDWFKSQYGFSNVIGPVPPYGTYTLVGDGGNATAYPYANIETWKPVIISDSAYPQRQDGEHYWVDVGLIVYPGNIGNFSGGPVVGLQFQPGVLFWYDKWMVVKREYTKKNGVVVPACIKERFDSRTTTYSNIVPNIRGDTQDFLISQLVTENGEIGYYNDFLTKMYGTEGIWEGNGTEWETSRLTVTWKQYSRP